MIQSDSKNTYWYLAGYRYGTRQVHSLAGIVTREVPSVEFAHGLPLQVRRVEGERPTRFALGKARIKSQVRYAVRHQVRRDQYEQGRIDAILDSVN